MRIMLDTNVIISAILFPKGKAAQAFLKAVSAPPAVISDAENKIRDPKDRPILRAALNEHAELFVTGDKDFLESSVTDPRIMSVAEFLSI